MPQELEGRRRALKTENGQILNTRGAIHFKKGDKAAALKDWQAAVDVWAELLPQTDSLANPLFVRPSALFLHTIMLLLTILMIGCPSQHRSLVQAIK